MSTFYVTTPIYYVNARPHLGHAYTTIVADCMKKFHTMLGLDVKMLTGTDEHGDKIVKAAQKASKNPKEFVDEISAEFQNLWQDLDLQYDQFIRTTEPKHQKSVQALLQRIYDKGDIYYGEYGGHYCFGCERFYTEKELADGLCPQHQSKPEFISEKNYFFKMSKYQDWLKTHILENPDFIRPERYRNEVLAMLESNVLEDLCISRPKTRLEWGIELPFDKDYVCYVWFDALANYISALGWPDNEGDTKGDFAKYWPPEHLVAKDILKPHGVFWPTMLKAADLPIYKHLNVHGYWLINDTKMSKSLGNIVDPRFAAKHFGLDAFRYFLLREMNFGSDASYSEEALINRINADLANDLGNLFSRVLSMNAKYFEQKNPKLGPLTSEDENIFAITEQSSRNYLRLFKEVRFSAGIDALWDAVRSMNKYVDTMAPWALYKEENFERLGTVIRVLLENMYKVAYLIYPIMPTNSITMQKQLGMDFNAKLLYADKLENFLTAKSQLQDDELIASSSNLFPRLDKVNTKTEHIKAKKTEKKKEEKTSQEKQSESSNIEFADFQKLDLRVGTIVKADPHPDADKLLRFDVDLGEENTRQIISGIAEFFKPETLVGQKVVVVANLPPRKLRGLVSHGMILTAEYAENLSLLTANAPSGSKVT